MRIVNRWYLAALLPPLLLLLLFPALRIPAQKLAMGTNRGLYELPLLSNNGYIIPTEEVLRRDPESLEVQIWAVSNGGFPPQLKKFERTDRSKGKFLAFAQLAKDHPRSALLLICALNALQGRDGRVAGPWEDGSGWTLFAAPGPESSVLQAPFPGVPFAVGGPYSQVPKNTFTTAEIALALQLARHGQKLEPNNTFFDWMVARCLFAARRDDEAVQVLIAASHKTGFDMHWRELWLGSIHSLEIAAPLLAEEKAAIGSFMLLRHLSSIRHVHHMALWSAMQKEDAGDAEGALEIEGALARLAIVWNERALFSIEALTGASLAYSTWSAPTEMRWFRVLNVGKPQEKNSSHAVRLNRRLNEFSTYARRHGRADLALEAAHSVPRLQQFYREVNTPKARGSFLWHTSGGPITAIFLSSDSALLALYQFGLAFALLVFFTIWGPLLPPRGEVPPRLNSRFLVYPLVVGGAFSVILAAFQRFFLLRAWSAGYGWEMSYNDANSADAAQWLTYPAILFPIVLGALVCFAGGVYLKRQAPPMEKRELSLRELGASASEELAFRWFWNAQRKFWWVFLPISAVCLALFGAASSLFFQLSYDATNNVGLAFFVCGGLWLVAIFLRWRFAMPRPQRGAVYAGFFAFRRVLAWTLPLSLWLLIWALWLSIKPRLQAEMELKQFLASENRSVASLEVRK